MEFRVLSLEMILFIVVALVYSRLRKASSFSLQSVKDMTIYIPPSKEDFSSIFDKLTPVKEVKGGKKNKNSGAGDKAQ